MGVSGRVKQKIVYGRLVYGRLFVGRTQALRRIYFSGFFWIFLDDWRELSEFLFFRGFSTSELIFSTRLSAREGCT
jgi:hypothetical protein